MYPRYLPSHLLLLILVLNSNDYLDKQTGYIKQKLSKSTAKWKIVVCHHSIFSPAKGRDFEFARKNWKPLFDKYGVDLAQDLSILYGGSCKPSNAQEIFSKEDVDGGLIGGASLNANDFSQIINAF